MLINFNMAKMASMFTSLLSFFILKQTDENCPQEYGIHQRTNLLSYAAYHTHGPQTITTIVQFNVTQIQSIF